MHLDYILMFPNLILNVLFFLQLIFLTWFKKVVLSKSISSQDYRKEMPLYKMRLLMGLFFLNGTLNNFGFNWRWLVLSIFTCRSPCPINFPISMFFYFINILSPFSALLTSEFMCKALFVIIFIWFFFSFLFSFFFIFLFLFLLLHNHFHLVLNTDNWSFSCFDGPIITTILRQYYLL